MDLAITILAVFLIGAGCGFAVCAYIHHIHTKPAPAPVPVPAPVPAPAPAPSSASPPGLSQSQMLAPIGKALNDIQTAIVALDAKVAATVAKT